MNAPAFLICAEVRNTHTMRPERPCVPLQRAGWPPCPTREGKASVEAVCRKATQRLKAQLDGWTEGTKSVRDKRVKSPCSTPSRNAGRGCGFRTFLTAFPYLFGGTVAITFWEV